MDLNMRKFLISTYINSAFIAILILISGTVFSGCGLLGGSQSQVTLDNIKEWCKIKNDLPIYPHSEARGQSAQGVFEGRTLWNAANVHEVDSWYMKEFDAKRWEDWGFWKRNAEETKEHTPTKYFFLTDGKTEISLSLLEQSKGTSILMSASPHEQTAETHLENVYKCIRKGKNVTHVFIDK
jgi:hypothetical protein